MPVALKIVNAPPEVEMRARQLFTAGLITRLIDFAPYSASLVRIYFAYSWRAWKGISEMR
jgi:hypothetical protein